VLASRQRNFTLTAQRQARHWTQDRLCEQFELTALELGLRIGISPRQVRRWESGEITTPRADHRLVLEALFGLPLEHLGFSLPNPAHQGASSRARAESSSAYVDKPIGLDSRSELDSPGGLAGLDQPWTQDGAVAAIVEVSRKAPVDRRDFTALTGSALTAPVLSWMCNPEPFTAAFDGGRIGTSIIKAVEQRIEAISRIDDEAGGGAVLDAISTDLQMVARLVKNASYTETVGRQLYAAMAGLAERAGWVFFDSNRHAAAQSYWLAGLRAAHITGDRARGGYVLGWMSYQAACVGDPKDAISFIQAAETGSKGAITPAVSAVLAALSARSYAQIRDKQAYSAAVNRAFTLLDRSQQGEEPSWAYWITEATLNDLAGNCFLAAGDFYQAVRHLDRGLGLLDESFVRDQAEHLTSLAVAYLRQREVEQACTTGVQALNLLVDQVNSPRIISSLRGFQRELAPYRAQPCVRDFTEQARQVLVR